MKNRINIGNLWWAWVDLNHRPRPYQLSHCFYCGLLRLVMVLIYQIDTANFARPDYYGVPRFVI